MAEQGRGSGGGESDGGPLQPVQGGHRRACEEDRLFRETTKSQPACGRAGLRAKARHWSLLELIVIGFISYEGEVVLANFCFFRAESWRWGKRRFGFGGNGGR